MPMTTNDLAWVRAEVGAQPDDTTLNASYDAGGGFRALVALDIWRARYADMLRTPAALGADGLSISTSANLQAMQKKIDRLTIIARNEGAPIEGFGAGRFRRWDREHGWCSDDAEHYAAARACRDHLSESELLNEIAVGPFPYGGL